MFIDAYLIEVGVGFGFSNLVEISDVNELEVKEEACVGRAVLCPGADVGQVAQLLVPPVVQVAQTLKGRKSTHLSVYLKCAVVAI